MLGKAVLQRRFPRQLARSVVTFAREIDQKENVGGGLVGLSMLTLPSGLKSQAQVVQALQDNGVLESKLAATAFAAVDRALFVPLQHDAAVYAEPYENAPVKLDAVSGSTMSTPHHHAMVCEPIAAFLQDRGASPAKVLDYGCGTGYLTTVFAEMLRVTGAQQSTVCGVDAVPELIKVGKEVQERSFSKEIRDMIELLPAYRDDGSSYASNSGCFDLIHAGFAIPATDDLLELLLHRVLAPNGRFVGSILLPSGEQELVVVDKSIAGELTKTVVLRPVYCQAMMSGMLDESKARMSTADEIEAVKEELEAWKTSFKSQHGKSPSHSDLLGDPVSRELFDRFAALRKRVWDKV